MSILIDRETRVVVQGITGRDGSLHSRLMAEYGTRVVAGVTPGKGGTRQDGVPVFETVREAVEATGANTSAVFVPPAYAAEAILEGSSAGVGLVIAVTEGIPTLDVVRVMKELTLAGTRMVGPNCPGLISPGKAKVGIIPGGIATPGSIGLVSRSGTLTYEVVMSLTRRGMGQTTCLGIGGDPVIGTTFLDALPLFEADPETRAVVVIGEIGGTDEELAARYVKEHMTKPVVGFIAGRTAPPGKRMGHAGAIISGGTGTAEEKIAAFQAAGISVAKIPSEIPDLVAKALARA